MTEFHAYKIIYEYLYQLLIIIVKLVKNIAHNVRSVLTNIKRFKKVVIL